MDLGNPGNLYLVLCVRHKNTVMLIYQKNTPDERRVWHPSVVLAADEALRVLRHKATESSFFVSSFRSESDSAISNVCSGNKYST